MSTIKTINAIQVLTIKLTTKESNTMNYGDKRDYPKIDIFWRGAYQSSTTWAKTCREAVEHYKTFAGITGSEQVTAKFAK